MKTSSLLFCFAVLFLAGCKQNEQHKQEEATKFIVTTPQQKDTLIYQEYVSQIHSIQHIELRALEKGYLEKIYVDEGQPVKKGQLLFQIMPVIYQAETKISQAELSAAEIEFQNTKALADSQIVSKNELAMAKAKLQKARADLDLSKAHLGFTQIRAPFDGIIGKFNDVRLGSLLDEGELLTTLSDNNKVWVYFNVPEAEYLNYAAQRKTDPHASVKLQLANNALYDQDGVIETIEADFNNETGNIAFRATFANPYRILRHGETGNILMPTPLKNALLIPQKATFEILDKKYVYVVDASNKVAAREISIQQEIPHIYVVSSGVQPTDKILVEGIRKVKNGDTIHYEQQSFDAIIRELQKLKAE
ncbi:membrane fusion protein, multidrug efflux system [Cnuella takakiae]|uniref:Membrane fusion protein, multidrug efflux system n=1 Tax=Cnuella takakiae TaxID=1302690 RepID=A0A1M5EDN4_9BACT|nr:efflux RND transporter periplasmic adaptor subunit [Cnuella takakiae]OLY91145.1 efflux transporter periplasmic adaptor subunit [Cnuella takakiae]SHF77306.1 membrane fusion protein, multidrug efflux system [Cnuella takakiae]